MSYTDKAIEALRGAESSLRTIITQALAANAYREVSKVATAADSIAALVGELGGSSLSQRALSEQVGAPAEHQRSVPTPTAARLISNAASRRGYPRFLRDGDRLLKVAWSKKERQPYEHRAPQAIVQDLLKAVRQRKGEGKLFQAADVLPLSNANGEEYPSYQTYLALAWLRHVGVVTKKGRDGYVVKAGAATPDKLVRLWASLQTED
jgi:hypothetical protein